MTLLAAWLLFPAVLVAVCLGCGLLLQWATGRQLPGPLLVPGGFAVLIVAASFTTMTSTTAPVTTPFVVVLAIVGFALTGWSRPRLDWWALGAGVAVFAVYAAPIVLSGSATFAGIYTIDDTASWLGMADNALQHGRSLATLAPSSYEAPLHDLIASGYPLGSFLPLGIGHELSRVDSAWIIQPLMALEASLLGLSIYSLSSGLIERRPLRAGVALVGASSALLFSYAFWSGIKEVTAATLVGLVAAVIVAAPASRWRPRDLLPTAVAGAALLDVLSVTGAVWLTAFGCLGVVLVVFYRVRGLLLAASLAAATLILSIPALAIARLFVNAVTQSGAGKISATSQLGNLLRPLSTLQLFGIWPVYDFRVRPSDMTVTYVLIAVLTVAVCYGLVTSARRRSWGIPLYVTTALAGALSLVVAKALGDTSPWLVAKALATASPALVVAGAAGAALLFENGRRVEAVVCALAIAGGVGWSDALTYTNVWLAPRDQLVELQSIGARFAGEGPTLMTEPEPYGVQHFLRSMDPTGASQRRALPIYLLGGSMLDKLQYADLDDFQLGSILPFRTLVLRTSPDESRPPSPYHPVWIGRFYEVWQRPTVFPTILEHLPLGDEEQPVATPSCSAVMQVAAVAAAHRGGSVVAAVRAPAETYDLGSSQHPASWKPAAGGTVLPNGPGTATLSVTVPTSGSYGFWVGGSFRDRLEVDVDGRRVGVIDGDIDGPAQTVPFGTVRLAAGSHTVLLRYSGPGLRPGSGGYQFSFGPLTLGLPAATARLVTVSPSQARSLCGKSYDWLEAVTP
jgi:hypothetical protein